MRLATVPAIVDHDGPDGQPYTVFESGAILIYLADKTAMFLPDDAKKKCDTLQWLMFQVGGIGPMFGQLAHFALFAPKDVDNAYAFARYRTEVKRLYEVMEKRLARTPYLAGEDYTVADVATFPWTRLHDSQGVKWEDNPSLARWYNAISARPAVQAALSKVAAVKSTREIASPDQRDRLFNRGRYIRI
jgi:GSH-dependent disulfide-bond oxidoreductase